MILTAVEQMGSRVDELEKSITDLIKASEIAIQEEENTPSALADEWWTLIRYE